MSEQAVMQCVRRQDLVLEIFEVGLIFIDQESHLSCSPDGVALLDVPALLQYLYKTAWSEIEAIEVNRKPMWIAPVEIKTKVAASTLGHHIHLSSKDAIFFGIEEEVCRKYIRFEHIPQVVQQETVL